jgi:phenylpyruvate tautomerase PptA (4-oxalocrotonate tautomerase family)
MPWYDVEHAITLTPTQCDTLAEKITYLHTRTFMVPALLVNVQFRDASKDNTYVAGKRKLSNRIQANLRVGPGRPVQMYDELAEQLEKAWYEVVGAGKGKELRAVLINGGRVTGREAGFVINAASGIGREVGARMN